MYKVTFVANKKRKTLRFKYKADMDKMIEKFKKKYIYGYYMIEELK